MTPEEKKRRIAEMARELRRPGSLDSILLQASEEQRVCNFTQRKRDPDRPERTAWCQTHKRWAEQCSGDPIDATLSHLVADAEPKAKTCPHCGEVLK